MSYTFEQIAWRLSEKITYSEDLLTVSSIVADMLQEQDNVQPKLKHDDLVKIAIDSIKINDFLAQDKKIAAIKHLRFLTNCGLKPAKDAIEDERVSTVARLKNIPAWPSEDEYPNSPF